MRENLSKVERQLYQLIVEETVAGRPPIAARLVELTGRSRGGVHDALARLSERGLVSQGYDRGPYVPVAMENGQPIQIQLVLGVKPFTPGPDNQAKVEAITRKARAKLGLDPDTDEVPEHFKEAIGRLFDSKKGPEPSP